MAGHRFSAVQGLRVVLAMGWADFVLKYRGSVLGYFWSLIGPLVKFLVILYVFGPYVRSSIPLYPLYLFLGIIIWEHFIVTTSSCMVVLFEKEGIVQRLPFPRIFIVLATGWTNLIIFITHLLIFFCFGWYFHISAGISFVYLVIIALQMTFVALGVGMLLASYCLRYRDMMHLWAVLTQILFWLTPIMYPYSERMPLTNALAALSTSPGLHSLRVMLDLFIHFQPVAIIIHDARRITLYAASAGTPTLLHAVAMTGACVALFLFGKWIFDRRSPFFNQEY